MSLYGYQSLSCKNSLLPEFAVSQTLHSFRNTLTIQIEFLNLRCDAMFFTESQHIAQANPEGDQRPLEANDFGF